MVRRSTIVRRHVDDPEIVEERVIDDEPVLESERESVMHETAEPFWSPAQIVTLALGIAFIAFGGVALARAGVDAFFDHVSVGGFHHTQVLALVHLGAGIMFLAGAASPWGARGVMAFIGAVSLVFGIIILIEPTAFHESLAVHENHGVLYVVVGAISLLFGIISPVFGGGRHRSYRRWRW